MEEIIRVKDKFYILATSSLADDRTRVLKHGETFAIFDRYGDIQPIGLGEQGIYHEGTRFLSRLELRIGKDRPLLLSSTVKEDNALLAVDLTNPDIYLNGRVLIPRGTLHIFRARFLWQGVCYERLRISNYGLFSVNVSFSIHFQADFADIFEVRGLKRERRGRRLEDIVGERDVVLGYEGLDGVVRRTRIGFSPKPVVIGGSEARFEVSIQPKEQATLFLTVSCESDGVTPALPYDEAFSRAGTALKAARAEECEIYTSNEQFNDWLNRSMADLHMMITDLPEGAYPYAGVPWFSTIFGRDGIITALECLWINPGIAKGVLAHLASTQAKETVPELDAEPGKILHESRKGEMATLGEIPFGRYYGSVDATPLFCILAGAYYDRTGDRGFIEAIWPSIELALRWMDTYGDLDGDGFLEYFRRSSSGLIHQGWKDSPDSVFHSDGILAEAPIALCEVQGYAYAARHAAARLAAALGLEELAEGLKHRAQDLKERFERSFWCEELSTYALALDGKKRPCYVRASNAGHCLFTGIADPHRAKRVAETLLSQELFSGWGIRTLASSEVRYNPMSYHNGSIWPHDNALIAYGLARYGFKDLALRVFTGLFDASLFLDLHRMPELFCGFPRRPGEGPTLYPVACAPQSWAAASVFLLLQSCLGLSINGFRSEICFCYPVLPEFLQRVEIKNLRVGSGLVDLLLQRYQNDVGINVTRKEDSVRIVVVR
ncbi:MAG TPA: amylo-alpha-1,6-glucosidase [Thermodesulfobacteriota bacterium]|nr:amylo-alpha-1,6-glucosidase [Thermodesulfobacteriota bacterium]